MTLGRNNAQPVMPTVGRQVGEIIFGLGIRRVYGLPGEDHMALMAGFADVGLQYVTAYNESSAVIMAATDAQLTGLPGVVILSLAPGVSNGVNGLLNTYMEQLPLLLISGQHAAGRLPFVVRQGFNIEQLVTPMTKWRARVTADMDIPSLVGKAIDESMSGRPGPVYLELPDGVATAQSTSGSSSSAAVATLTSRWSAESGAAAVAPSSEMVSRLSARLAAASRPALVVGGRSRRLSSDSAAAFASTFRVPVFTSSRQKGLLDGSCPYFAGTFLNGRLERQLLEQSDLVLMVDPESFDFYNKPWCFDADAIALTDAAFAEWMNPFSERLVTEPDAMLRALVSAAPAVASKWEISEITQYRDDLRAKLLDVQGKGMSVAQAVDAALSAWPSEGYLVADAGFSKPLVAMLSEPSAPDHFLASNALSTMGYSIPATIGARRAGARPILSFLGDGSLLMRATELMVDASDEAPSVFVAMMDRSLTQIEVKQERRQLAPVGVALPPLSCARIGDAFGIAGVDVDNVDALRAEVASGMERNGPTLIGALVDPVPSRELFDLLRG